MPDQDYRIHSDPRESVGGFMCPPGHPNHTYSVHSYPSARARNADGYYSLDSILDADWVPARVRAQAQRIMDAAELVCSELWVRHVYGYFRNMYLSETGSRDVSDLVTDPANALPAGRHAAVALVRQYFPDHQPRVDLIADPRYGYGSYECVKCGVAVQYDASIDALAPYDTRNATCTSGGGGRHEWPAKETANDATS